MTLAIEYYDGNAVAQGLGVYIPVADLPGVNAAELANVYPAAVKEGKVILALLNRISRIVSPDSFDKLGFAITKEAPDGVDVDIFNQVFAITYQWVVGVAARTVDVVPVPNLGTNTGKGDFWIIDVFPGSFKVGPGSDVAAGIVINDSGLTQYVNSALITDLDIDGDGRAWFAALAEHLTFDSIKRGVNNSSAVVSALASNYSASAITPDMIDATDPTTGIPPADAKKYALINRTDTVTVQLALNQDTQVFEVLVASA